MSQCSPHGSTNSTLRSVRRIRPVVTASLSRLTRIWAPFEGLMRTGRSTPARASVSSVQAPVARTVTRAWTSWSQACFGVPDGHALDPAVVMAETDHLGPVEGDGAVRHRRPHQLDDIAGVVTWAS